MIIRTLIRYVSNAVKPGRKSLHILMLACLPLLSACDSQPAVKPLAASDVILAFGDSLTVGVGATPAESYPAVLEQLSGHKVVNAGVSGETSDLGLRRLPDVIAEYQPKLIIICHGGNDILRRKSMLEAEQNIRAMIKMAKDRNIDVILIAVPAFNLWAESPAFYANIADELQVPFEADIIGELQKDRKVKSDSVHFNAKGYRLLAEAVLEVLQEAKAIQE